MKKMKKLFAIIMISAIVLTGFVSVNNAESVQAAENAVNADLLKVKVQVANNGKSVMRFVSSVDHLDYANVGFVVTPEGESEKTYVTNTVYERIESETEGVVYSFSPKVIDTASVYFVTAKMNVEAGKNYTVKAFVTPMNGGERIYGQSRCVALQDGSANVLNMSVNSALDNNADYSAEYTNASGTKVVVNGDNFEILDGTDTYTNVRLKNADTNLKSATKISIKNSSGTEVATTVFRNYHTEYAGVADTSWYDVCVEENSSEDEFVIATNADLYGFSALVKNNTTTFEGKTIYQVADISLNDLSAVDWATGTIKTTPYNWTPIGYRDSSSVFHYFQGTYDGNMHSIYGLYLKTSARFSGLFGAVGQNATLKNFKLEDSYCESSVADFGSVIGIANGTMENIYSSATVKVANARVGGMIGQIQNGVTMKGCWFDGTFTNTTKSAKQSGGFAGYVGGKTTITGCLNSGTVDCSTFNTANSNNAAIFAPSCGGFFGDVISGSNTTITGCLNVGKILVNDVVTAAYGPIIGYRNGTVSITNTYATAESCKSFDKSNINNLVTSVPAASIAGDAAVTTLTNLDWNNYWETASAHPIMKCYAEDVIDISWFDANKDVFVLYDRADLYGLASLVNAHNTFAGKTVKLGGDIILNTGDATTWSTKAPKYNWTPIGYRDSSNVFHGFDGVFDGNMHTISGMYLNSAARFSGLFGVTGTTATVKNLILTNSYVKSAYADNGSVAGYGRGTFDTMYSDAIVSVGNARCGGMFGQLAGGTVKNCWFDGAVTLTATNGAQIGGIVGYTSGTNTFNNCLNTATVDMSAYTYVTPSNGLVVPQAGGIIGSSNNTTVMAYCLNVGDVIVNSNASTAWGAIVGYRGSGTVQYPSVYATNECINDHTKTNVVNYKKVAEEDILGPENTVKEVLSDLFADANAGFWSVGVSESDFVSLTSFVNMK